MKKLFAIALILALSLPVVLLWPTSRGLPDRLAEAAPAPVESPLRSTAHMPGKLAEPKPDTSRVRLQSTERTRQQRITAPELEAAIERYFKWLNAMEPAGLTAWLRVSNLEDLEDPIRTALLIDALRIEPGQLSADEQLYSAYRTAARRLSVPLVNRTVVEFHRQTLGPSEVLWKHTLSRLTSHLDHEGLQSRESAAVFQAASDYISSWTPDAGLSGTPWPVLLPLLRASAALPDGQLLEALTLLEIGLERGVLDTAGVMHQIALLPALFGDQPGRRETLDRVIPWLQAADRPEGIAWGYVEFLRAMRVDHLIEPAEVASPVYTPDSLFDREPVVAWAALELLAGFGGPSAGARLRAVFWHWLERIRAGDTRIRQKDLSVALGFAAQAENGLNLEELLPLFDDPLVGGLLLNALVFLAEKDPSDPRIQAIWREAVVDASIDDETRSQMLHHMITFDMASIGDLDRWLFQEGLQEMAAWGLLKAGEVRPIAMTAIAIESQDEAFATDMVQQLAEAAPEEGGKLAEQLLDANLISLRTRGATWLVALACIAERRGQPTLAAQYRGKVSSLGPDQIDASAFEGTGTMSGSELLKILAPSLLAEPDKLDDLWLSRALPESEKPQSE